jgi:hypothetical protein
LSRAIDALIDHYVWGYEPADKIETGRKDHFIYLRKTAGGEGVPRYSSDTALAIGVLEKLRERDPGRPETWKLWAHGGSCYGVGIYIDMPIDRCQEMDYGIPLPLAICTHVLHVLGVSVETPAKPGVEVPGAHVPDTTGGGG